MDQSEFDEETKDLKNGRVYIVLQDSETKEDFEEHGFFKVMIFDTTESQDSADADISSKSTSFVVANDDLAQNSSTDNVVNFTEFKKKPNGRPH
jgi:hypothetical protein